MSWDAVATARLKFGGDELAITTSTLTALDAVPSSTTSLLQAASKARNLDLSTLPATVDDADCHMLRMAMYNRLGWAISNCPTTTAPSKTDDPQPATPHAPPDVSESGLECLVEMVAALLRIPLVQEAHLAPVLLKPVDKLLTAAGPLSLAPGAPSRPHYLTDGILRELSGALAAAAAAAGPDAGAALGLWVRLCQSCGQLGPVLRLAQHLLRAPHATAAAPEDVRRAVQQFLDLTRPRFGSLADALACRAREVACDAGGAGVAGFAAWTGFHDGDTGGVLMCGYRPGALALFRFRTPAAKGGPKACVEAVRRNDAFPHRSARGSLAWVGGRLLFSCPELGRRDGDARHLQLVCICPQSLQPQGTVTVRLPPEVPWACLRLFSDGATLYIMSAAANAWRPLRRANAEAPETNKSQGASEAAPVKKPDPEAPAADGEPEGGPATDDDVRSDEGQGRDGAGAPNDGAGGADDGTGEADDGAGGADDGEAVDDGPPAAPPRADVTVSAWTVSGTSPVPTVALQRVVRPHRRARPGRALQLSNEYVHLPLGDGSLSLKEGCDLSVALWVRQPVPLFGGFSFQLSGSDCYFTFGSGERCPDSGLLYRDAPLRVTVHKHPLAYSTREVCWVCDGQRLPGGCRWRCGSVQEGGGAVDRYRCEGCNFDLCGGCARAYAVVPHADRPGGLGQGLTTFTATWRIKRKTWRTEWAVTAEELEPLRRAQWVHLAVVSAGPECALYVNGRRLQATPAAPAPDAFPYETRVVPALCTLLGSLQVAGLAVWRAAQPEADVRRVYTRGALAADAAELVGYWPMDEGAGLRVVDWSPHERHGAVGPSGEWVPAAPAAPCAPPARAGPGAAALPGPVERVCVMGDGEELVVLGAELGALYAADVTVARYDLRTGALVAEAQVAASAFGAPKDGPVWQAVPPSGGTPLPAHVMALHPEKNRVLVSRAVRTPDMARAARQSLSARYDGVAEYLGDPARPLRGTDVAVLLLAACDRAAFPLDAADGALPPPAHVPFAVDLQPEVLEDLVELLRVSWTAFQAQPADAARATLVLCFCLRLLQANCRALLQRNPDHALDLKAADPAGVLPRLQELLTVVVDDARLVGARDGAAGDPAAQEVHTTACDMFCALVAATAREDQLSAAMLRECLQPPAGAAQPPSQALLRRSVLGLLTRPAHMKRLLRDALAQHRADGASALLSGITAAAFEEAAAAPPRETCRQDVLLGCQLCLGALAAHDPEYRPLFFFWCHGVCAALDAHLPLCQRLLADPADSLLRLVPWLLLALGALRDVPEHAPRLAQYAYRLRLWLQALEGGPADRLLETVRKEVALGRHSYRLQSPAEVPPSGWHRVLRVPGARELVATFSRGRAWRWGTCYLMASRRAALPAADVFQLAVAGGEASLPEDCRFEADTLEVHLIPDDGDFAGQCGLSVCASDRVLPVLQSRPLGAPKWVGQQVAASLRTCVAVIAAMLRAVPGGGAALDSTVIRRYLNSSPLLQCGLVEAVGAGSGPGASAGAPGDLPGARLWQRLKERQAQQPQHNTPPLPPAVTEALQLLFAALLRHQNLAEEADALDDIGPETELDLPVLAVFTSAYDQWRSFLEMHMSSPAKLQAVSARCRFLAEDVLPSAGDLPADPESDFLTATSSFMGSSMTMSRSTSLGASRGRLSSLRLTRDWAALYRQWKLRYSLQRPGSAARPHVTRSVIEFATDERVDAAGFAAAMQGIRAAAQSRTKAWVVMQDLLTNRPRPDLCLVGSLVAMLARETRGRHYADGYTGCGSFLHYTLQKGFFAVAKQLLHTVQGLLAAPQPETVTLTDISCESSLRSESSAPSESLFGTEPPPEPEAGPAADAEACRGDVLQRLQYAHGLVQWLNVPWRRGDLPFLRDLGLLPFLAALLRRDPTEGDAAPGAHRAKYRGLAPPPLPLSGPYAAHYTNALRFGAGEPGDRECAVTYCAELVAAQPWDLEDPQAPPVLYFEATVTVVLPEWPRGGATPEWAFGLQPRATSVTPAWHCARCLTDYCRDCCEAPVCPDCREPMQWYTRRPPAYVDYARHGGGDPVCDKCENHIFVFEEDRGFLLKSSGRIVAETWCSEFGRKTVTVGCALVPATRRLYFTRDGQPLGPPIALPASASRRWFPTVHTRSCALSVRANFGDEPFAYQDWAADALGERPAWRALAVDVVHGAWALLRGLVAAAAGALDGDGEGEDPGGAAPHRVFEEGLRALAGLLLHHVAVVLGSHRRLRALQARSPEEPWGGLLLPSARAAAAGGGAAAEDDPSAPMHAHCAAGATSLLLLADMLVLLRGLALQRRPLAECEELLPALLELVAALAPLPGADAALQTALFLLGSLLPPQPTAELDRMCAELSGPRGAQPPETAPKPTQPTPQTEAAPKSRAPAGPLGTAAVQLFLSVDTPHTVGLLSQLLQTAPWRDAVVAVLGPYLSDFAQVLRRYTTAEEGTPRPALQGWYHCECRDPEDAWDCCLECAESKPTVECGHCQKSLAIDTRRPYYEGSCAGVCSLCGKSTELLSQPDAWIAEAATRARPPWASATAAGVDAGTAAEADAAGPPCVGAGVPPAVNYLLQVLGVLGGTSGVPSVGLRAVWLQPNAEKEVVVVFLQGTVALVCPLAGDGRPATSPVAVPVEELRTPERPPAAAGEGDAVAGRCLEAMVDVLGALHGAAAAVGAQDGPQPSEMYVALRTRSPLFMRLYARALKVVQGLAGAAEHRERLRQTGILRAVVEGVALCEEPRTGLPLHALETCSGLLGWGGATPTRVLPAQQHLQGADLRRAVQPTMSPGDVFWQLQCCVGLPAELAEEPVVAAGGGSDGGRSDSDTEEAEEGGGRGMGFLLELSGDSDGESEGEAAQGSGSEGAEGIKSDDEESDALAEFLAGAIVGAVQGAEDTFGRADEDCEAGGGEAAAGPAEGGGGGAATAQATGGARPGRDVGAADEAGAGASAVAIAGARSVPTTEAPAATETPDADAHADADNAGPEGTEEDSAMPPVDDQACDAEAGPEEEEEEGPFHVAVSEEWAPEALPPFAPEVRRRPPEPSAALDGAISGPDDARWRTAQAVDAVLCARRARGLFLACCGAPGAGGAAAEVASPVAALQTFLKLLRDGEHRPAVEAGLAAYVEHYCARRPRPEVVAVVRHLLHGRPPVLIADADLRGPSEWQARVRSVAAATGYHVHFHADAEGGAPAGGEVELTVAPATDAGAARRFRASELQGKALVVKCGAGLSLSLGRGGSGGPAPPDGAADAGGAAAPARAAWVVVCAAGVATYCDQCIQLGVALLRGLAGPDAALLPDLTQALYRSAGPTRLAVLQVLIDLVDALPAAPPAPGLRALAPFLGEMRALYTAELGRNSHSPLLRRAVRLAGALHAAQSRWTGAAGFTPLAVFDPPPDAPKGDAAAAAPDPEDYVDHRTLGPGSDSDSDSGKGGQWCWPLLPQPKRRQLLKRKKVRARALPVQLLAADDVCQCVLEGRLLPAYCRPSEGQYPVQLRIHPKYEDARARPRVAGPRVFWHDPEQRPTAVTGAVLVRTGKWYYEVRNLSSKRPRVGWHNATTKESVLSDVKVEPGKWLGVWLDCATGKVAVQVGDAPARALDARLGCAEGVAPYAELATGDALHFVFDALGMRAPPRPDTGGRAVADDPVARARAHYGGAPPGPAPGPRLDAAVAAELALYLNAALTVNPHLPVTEVPLTSEALRQYPLLSRSARDAPASPGPAPSDAPTLEETRDVLLKVNAVVGAALPLVVCVDDPADDRRGDAAYGRLRRLAPLLLLPTKDQFLALAHEAVDAVVGPSVTVNRFDANQHTSDPKVCPAPPPAPTSSRRVATPPPPVMPRSQPLSPHLLPRPRRGGRGHPPPPRRLHWTGGRYPPPPSGAQLMPSHCLPDAMCQFQWHL